MVVLIENEVLNTALLFGGVYPRNPRLVVFMKVVNQKKRVHENNHLTDVIY